MRVWRTGVVRWLIFISLYSVLAMFSLETRDPWSLSSSVWLPAGLVLGVLCTCPRAYWPVLGVSAGLLHVLASLLYGRSLDVALVFALLDLAVMFPLAILWRVTQYYMVNLSYRSEMMWLLAGVYVASLFGGFLSVLILGWADYPVRFSSFYTWSLSCATGCLAGAPYFIHRRFIREAGRKITFWQFVAATAFLMVFWLPAGFIQEPLFREALIGLTMGGLLLLSVMLSLRALTLYFMCLTLVVSVATLTGYGPLASGGHSGMQSSQLYLLLVISLGLILAARERSQTFRREQQQKHLSLLRGLLNKEQLVFFRVGPDSETISWFEIPSVPSIPVHEIPNFSLLQVRVHPEDRDVFTATFEASPGDEPQHRHCSVRVLLTDNQYHTVRCNVESGHPVFGTTGALLLYT